MPRAQRVLFLCCRALFPYLRCSAKAMSNVLTLTTRIVSYPDPAELDASEQALLQAAHQAAGKAYAPYSRFFVGAALLMANGDVATGNNQENAAYPSGICAERVAIFSASAAHPDTPVVKMAVVAHSNSFVINRPISPCGSCRQVLAEYERKFNRPIELLLQGASGEVYRVASVADILPLMFTADDLHVKP